MSPFCKWITRRSKHSIQQNLDPNLAFSIGKKIIDWAPYLMTIQEDLEDVRVVCFVHINNSTCPGIVPMPRKNRDKSTISLCHLKLENQIARAYWFILKRRNSWLSMARNCDGSDIWQIFRVNKNQSSAISERKCFSMAEWIEISMS